MTDNARHGNRGTRLTPPRSGLFLLLLVAVTALMGPWTNGLLARQDAKAPAAPLTNPTPPVQSADPLTPPTLPNLPPGTTGLAQTLPNPPPSSTVLLGKNEFQVTIGQFPPPIDPNTPVKELLPTPPKAEKIAPVSGDDLTKVPEVQFQAPLAKDTDALQQTAIQLARINHVNRSETDGFLKALVAERQDLAGLPFAMGDACRTKGERNRQFAQAVATVRQALGQQATPQVVPFGITNLDAPSAGPVPPTTEQTAPPPQRRHLLTRILTGRMPPTPEQTPPPVVSQPIPESVQQTAPIRENVQANTPAANFWTQYRTLCDQQDAAQARVDKEQCEHITLARIAALMQILAPESPSFRLGLVKYLSGVTHAEATRALARLALFSAEDEVRLAAVAALQVRRERDYTDVLVRGLRYPWPKVSRNAVDAIVRLKRTDLLPQLVALLEDADPRAPVVQEVGTKQVLVVNEMVRINHHRNCALCHSPGTNGDVSSETLTAGVPLPNEPLSGPSGGYRKSRSETLVRIDVTYLRQDFSMFQAVADANPWPEMQRFDFLVRTRQLTAEEAAAYREQFGSNDPTRPSAYQKAALAALREMTGRDTAPTAEAWRKLLELPARPQGKGTADISAPGPLSLQR